MLINSLIYCYCSLAYIVNRYKSFSSVVYKRGDDKTGKIMKKLKRETIRQLLNIKIKIYDNHKIMHLHGATKKAPNSANHHKTQQTAVTFCQKAAEYCRCLANTTYTSLYGLEAHVCKQLAEESAKTAGSRTRNFSILCCLLYTSPSPRD